MSLLTEAIGIEQFQHIQEKIAEVIVALETCKALLRAAEAERRAEPVRASMTPRLGAAQRCRNWYPRTYRASRRSCASSARAG